MSDFFRIHSSDKQVFINGTRLLGVQSCNISAQREIDEIVRLGNIKTTDRFSKAKPTAELSLDFIFCNSGQNDPFFDFKTGDVLSVENFDFNVIDLAGQTQLTSCYLNSYSLKASVGEIARGSVAYECDQIDFQVGAPYALNYEDQSSDDFKVYTPNNITVVPQGFESEGIATSGVCIQDFDLSWSLTRIPIAPMGAETPSFRYIELPVNGSIEFNVIKHHMTGINLSGFLLETGSLTLRMESDQNEYRSFQINNCSLIGINEDHSLDDNAMLTFNYDFSVDNESIFAVKNPND